MANFDTQLGPTDPWERGRQLILPGSGARDRGSKLSLFMWSSSKRKKVSFSLSICLSYQSFFVFLLTLESYNLKDDTT